MSREIRELTGRFGKLVILHRTAKRQNDKIVWICRCDCGNVVPVRSDNLTSGHVTSCGCFGSIFHRKLKPYEHLYGMMLYSAKERSLACDIDYERFVSFTKIPVCFYCREEVSWSPYCTKKNPSCAYQLDRRDPKVGYTEENCVVCCTRCNRSKSNTFTFEEWVEIGKCIQAFRERKVMATHA